MFGEMQENSKSTLDKDSRYKRVIVWPNVIIFIVIHFIALYGLYRFIQYSSWKTFAWGKYEQI